MIELLCVRGKNIHCMKLNIQHLMHQCTLKNLKPHPHLQAFVHTYVHTHSIHKYTSMYVYIDVHNLKILTALCSTRCWNNKLELYIMGSGKGYLDMFIDMLLHLGIFNTLGSCFQDQGAFCWISFCCTKTTRSCCNTKWHERQKITIVLLNFELNSNLENCSLKCFYHATYNLWP
jgi:hypothetical protein